MTFQASDGRGNHFLELLDDDLNAIEPHQVKGGPWLQLFGYSNSFALEQWEQSPTMLPSESIGYGFSRAWTFHVHVTIIPSS